jgi:MBG domain (YGX type)
VYGAAVPPLTVSYSGFVLNETQSVLSGSVAATSSVNASSAVGTYAISLTSTLTSANYSISYSNGSLSVTHAPLTVVANNKTPLAPRCPPSQSAMPALCLARTRVH